MPANSPTWVTDINATEERESRIQLALLRGVVENLKANRAAVPVFGLAIAAMFSQTVSVGHLAGWYCQMMLSLMPQAILLARFPTTILSSAEAKTWTRRIALVNLFFIANWASLGLAIVKGLVEAHGGRINLESQVGKSTRVTVHLPAIRVRPRAALQSAAA